MLSYVDRTMNFLHQSSYPYGGHAGIPLDQSGLAHPVMANAMDGYLLTRSPYELADYYNHMPMMEDYDEYAENLSRPRLTKEQVDTLEAQFQAHPKPNSNTKRELALRTNLTLPRVANWFQNRRAKAKQQKRQEEFERMQREAKEKDDQANSNKDDESADGQSEQGQRSPVQNNDSNSDSTKSPTPTQASSKGRPQTSDSSSLARQKHQKTGSDITREKTFASLQRALNAAVAARDHYSGSPDETTSAVTGTEMAFDVRHPSISAASTTSNTPQTSLNSTFSEWGSSRDSSIAWTPSQSPEDGYEFGSLNGVPFAPEVAHLDNSPNDDVAGSHGFGSINSRSQQQLWNTQMQGRPDIHASDSMYGPLSYSSMQPPSASSSRRPSSTEELAETINGIGINTTPLSSAMDSAMWRRPEKELDLAARRKRPRPAAIGTTHHRLVVGQSAVSPTTRMANFGNPHTIRHAKSSHTLGSRYAGVRKLSATQRSPLGFSSFAEATAANGGSEFKHRHRLHTSASVGNLAPPTPLTPEDLQQMLPTTTSDSQLGLTAHRLTDSQGLFPVTQSMQINVASPPETPMTMDMFSTIQYQNLVPPFSAPPQYASFTDYSPITTEPLTGVSWAVSTPDTSIFSNGINSQRAHQQPPTYIYEQDDDEQQDSNWVLSGEEGSSLYESTKASVTPPANMMTVSEEQDANGVTQFHIHEFPKQQEAHRNVAQQLAPQIPKNYTFSNQTPSDF